MLSIPLSISPQKLHTTPELHTRSSLLILCMHNASSKIYAVTIPLVPWENRSHDQAYSVSQGCP